MACFRPRVMQARAHGAFGFGDRAGDQESVRVPCGHCIGCKLDKGNAWSLRCQHEASLYDLNSFVTLTYDDDHLPADCSLHYPDVAGFLKRLRARFQGDHPGPDGKFPIRFFAAGEYGEQFSRPHYHLLLFNFAFPDRKPIGKGLYESDTLSDLWTFGLSSVGSVSPASASYCAQYSIKKVYGRVESDQHYGARYIQSGDANKKVRIRGRVPETIQMSRRPGLGAWWYQQFSADLFPRDYVVDTNGRQHRVPRYYQERFRLGVTDKYGGAFERPEWGEIKELREVAALRRDPADRSFSRLAAAEMVAESRLATFSQRTL